MKKLVLILLVSFIAVISYANSNRDSIPNHQISKEVVEKLSNEELIDLIKDVEYIRNTKNLRMKDEKPEMLFQHLSNRDFVKGLIISIFIFILLIISLPFYFNLRKTKSFHRLISTFIEKDKEIPENIAMSTFQSKTDLNKSIILVSTGISISLVILILDIGDRIWSIGLIPIIIGIGYYLASRLENKS
jgi:hypothetical protein